MHILVEINPLVRFFITIRSFKKAFEVFFGPFFLSIV